MSTLIFSKRPLDLEEEQRNTKRYKKSSLSTSSNDLISLPALDSLPGFKVNKLRVLFPYMNEEIISGVLTNCSQNVDAAIEALNRLNLSDSPQREHEENATSLSNSGIEEYKEAHDMLNDQEQTISQQRVYEDAQKQEKLNGIVEGTSQELLEGIQKVNNSQDATTMIKMVLKQYENTVLEEYEAKKVPKLEDENVSLKNHLNNLIKDVSILKRAVVVQNKMHQANQEKIMNADALREENERLNREVQIEKMNNYTLQCYLKMNEGGEMNMTNTNIF